ncbi:hypothetical protein KCV06_g372, partial [Aureobasidium melanogenum]
MHLVSRVRKRTLHLHVLQKVCRHCKNFVLMRPSVVLQPQAQMTRNSATLISSTCAGTAHVAWKYDAGEISPNNRYILLESSRMHSGGLLGQSLAASFPSSLCILLPMPSTLFFARLYSPANWSSIVSSPQIDRSFFKPPGPVHDRFDSLPWDITQPCRLVALPVKGRTLLLVDA